MSLDKLPPERLARLLDIVEALPQDDELNRDLRNALRELRQLRLLPVGLAVGLARSVVENDPGTERRARRLLDWGNTIREGGPE